MYCVAREITVGTILPLSFQSNLKASSLFRSRVCLAVANIANAFPSPSDFAPKGKCSETCIIFRVIFYCFFSGLMLQHHQSWFSKLEKPFKAFASLRHYRNYTSFKKWRVLSSVWVRVSLTKGVLHTRQ